MLEAVAAVEAMEGYSAPLEGRRGLLRLDFNENTLGPSPKVVEAIRAIPAEHYAIYPEYAGLAECYAASAGCRAEQVGLFNGVDAAILAVFLAFGGAGDVLLTTTPTFGYYGPCAQQRGMSVQAIPYEGEQFAFPLAAIGDALGQEPSVLMVCNPNNPTGTRLSPGQLLALARRAPRTLVVVDELYEAFSGDSVLPGSLALPNVLVLRSLSKTAGIAGLRVGFGIGDPGLIERLRRVTGPYDINAFGVAAAFAALADQAYVDAYVREVLAAKAWLTTRLARAGIRHHSSAGNFLLIWPEGDAEAVVQNLREAGILVRSMAGKPLIDGSFRVSIGTRPQMERFWQALVSCG